MNNKTYTLNSRNLFFLFSILLLVVFHKPLENILTNTIVDYALEYVEAIWYNDFIFIAIVLSTAIFVKRKYRQYVPSQKLLVFLVLLSIIYIIYRFFSSVWVFIPFSFYEKIKYADVLIIITSFNLLLLVRPKEDDKKDSINSFFNDVPLGENSVDELGYSNYAESIAAKIKESNFDKSFAIGINGKWGVGKTSFIDIVKRNIDDEKIVEIDFNTWASNSPEAIINDFFESMQEAIGPYHSSISRLLISYSNKLVALNENTLTKAVQTSVSVLTGVETTNSLFKEINSAIKKINKKIIIYIDDLDRLDKDEIIEVIRLIRNTANFHNTFFVVAYDRNYVVNALKSYNEYQEEKFLEKIFQLEITLPYFPKDILNRELARKLKEKLSEKYYQEIDDCIIGKNGIKSTFYWLENMRDVTRLANTLVLNLDKLLGEVALNDFVLLELLRYKYPSVYELLYREKENFFETIGSSNEKARFVLTKLTPTQIENIPSEYKDSKKKLELYLKRHFVELSVPENEVEKIYEYVDGLFVENDRFNFFGRSNLSIVYPSKFNRYFSYSLFSNELSEVEFGKAREMNQDDFNKKIDEWVNKDLEFQLQKRFIEISSYDNKDDLEKVINAIFYLAGKQTLKKSMFRGCIGYDIKDLYEKLSNYDDRTGKKYYSNPDETFKTFIKKIFDNAKSPYVFESEFIHSINYSYLYDDIFKFVLSKEELEDISFHYFKTYCEGLEKIDIYAFDLFNNCSQTIKVPAGGSAFTKGSKFPERVINCMKNLINKDFEGFILWMIYPYNQNETNRKEWRFNFSKGTVISIFEKLDNFETFIQKESYSKSEIIIEFKDFYQKSKSLDFREYIEFEFKKINIDTKFNAE